MTEIPLGKLVLEVGRPDTLFVVRIPNHWAGDCILAPPRFEIDGRNVEDFIFTGNYEQRDLPRNGTETTLRYVSDSLPGLQLTALVRSCYNSSFLRFKYVLASAPPVALTKTGGKDNLRYFASRLSEHDTVGLYEFEEIQISHFDPVAHTWQTVKMLSQAEELYDEQKFIGPICLLTCASCDFLFAYEHGAEAPNAFFEFVNKKQYNGQIELWAKQGNYYDEQVVSNETPFDSVWFQLGVSNQIQLDEYRQFMLEEVCENLESRKPYLFYNTWNYQERLKYFEGKPYLSDMNFDRMGREIDVAHRLGIDVFVIDTGWYGKTGDWEVNLERFPDGLREIKAKLDGCGMKLGLWFNPIVAAKTSKVYLEHPEYVMSQNGKESFWGPIWETEDSYGMCLCSDYADTFVETMVRLHRELGVTYFKWDAIGQYGCDSPHHQHGTEANSREERAACYAYEMGRRIDSHRGRSKPPLPRYYRGFRYYGGRAVRGAGVSVGRKIFSGQQRPVFPRLRYSQIGENGAGHDQRLLLSRRGPCACLPHRSAVRRFPSLDPLSHALSAGRPAPLAVECAGFADAGRQLASGAICAR